MNEPSGDSERPANPARPPRRGNAQRRGGRGRGRGERALVPAAVSSPEIPSETESTPAGATFSSSESPAAAPNFREARRESTRRPQLSPIAEATEKVEHIIHALRESLRELEEVLESLDDAQRQQIGDEKEIEKLRRSLSMLQREGQFAERESREARGRLEERGRPRTGDRPRPENRARPEEPRPVAESAREETAE